VRALRALRAAARRAGQAWRQLSLRARLVLGVVVLTAIGLLTAATVVYGQVQTFLTGQVDQQLSISLRPFLRQVYGQLSGNPAFFGPGFAGSLAFRQDTPRGTYGAIVLAGGQIYTQTFQENDALAPRPRVPADIVGWTEQSHEQVSTQYGTLAARHLTAGAVGDSAFQYRLISVSLPTTPSSVAVVGIPLADSNAVLNRLVLVELAASLGVLVLLAGLGYLVVRIGLRPLAEIERTAEAIAAGDLSRRVARDEPGTEVGRLGASLNSMLGQIEHAFDEQQASERRLRQFLADASHELRTPVTSIRGYSELFRRGASARPDDLALAMRRIEDESIRMGMLVDDLLLLARLDQGRPLDLARVDLAALAADAAADAQVLAPDREITLDAARPVVVTGDEQRLRQVATNLVQNALRHTPAGTPVEVRVGVQGSSAILAVRDEGPGLSPEHAARIFERFYRADPSRSRESGGTGLGLSIVKSIAEAHGGRARVETAPGRGATFVVVLPLADPSTAGGAGPDAPEGTEDPTAERRVPAGSAGGFAEGAPGGERLG
jgi:two-component system OmpR family sensor kinase